jgi:hypothetical protein
MLCRRRAVRASMKTAKAPRRTRSRVSASARRHACGGSSPCISPGTVRQKIHLYSGYIAGARLTSPHARHNLARSEKLNMPLKIFLLYFPRKFSIGWKNYGIARRLVGAASGAVLIPPRKGCG